MISRGPAQARARVLVAKLGRFGQSFLCDIAK
jgi:hypothetical protein